MTGAVAVNVPLGAPASSRPSPPDAHLLSATVRPQRPAGWKPALPGVFVS